ncbi:ZW10 [Bugula neritina]|uniref:ZW10 n=1 Tax=Bugula neritina TaxID=10212 RepID=A0A7J7JHA8_BUGNE|nr:ZW10 [Bugula neritina]
MSAGVKDTERCSPNLSEISSKSDELRVDVMEFLRSRYEDFDSRLDETSMLHKRWEQLSSTFDSTRTLIQDEIDSKTCSTVELAENSGILEKVNATLAVLSQLIRVHKLHQTVNNLLTCKDFTQAIVELQQMREALNTLQRDLPQLNIIKILNIEYTTLAQSLKHLMTEQWNSVVNISKQESGDVQTITFNIQTLQNRNHLSELCKALHSEEMLKLKLGSFADSLKMAFHWIVNYPKSVVTEETSANTLSVCVKRTASSTSPSWPSSVYKQLYRLLKPLAHRLLSIPLNSGGGINTTRYCYGCTPRTVCYSLY